MSNRIRKNNVKISVLQLSHCQHVQTVFPILMDVIYVNAL